MVLIIHKSARLLKDVSGCLLNVQNYEGSFLCVIHQSIRPVCLSVVLL